jgi:Protein of unknown function (DUF2726)
MRGIVTAKPLLSRPEQVLYGRLVRAFPGHIILAHVALSRLPVADRPDKAAPTQTIANRFRQLIVDFLVCRPDFTALAAVELDDLANPRDARRERDRRKDDILRAAGIKVVRLPGNDIPHEPALKALVATLPLNASTAQLVRRAS